MKRLRNSDLYFALAVTALAVTALIVLSMGCNGAGQAPISTNPAESDVQATRDMARRIADGTTAALAIVEVVGTVTDSLPIPIMTKDAIDCGIIKVTGTTAPPSAKVQGICEPIVGTLPNGPGPLHAALGKLGAITSQPSLRVTANEIIAALDPLIMKLETSTVPALRGFAQALRATLAVTRAFLGGAPTPITEGGVR